MMLLQKNATVTVSHSHTVDLAGFTRQADVLVAAAGHANMITADMVRPGAIVIDVGINQLPGGGIVGDVDFMTCQRSSWSYYTDSWWSWSIDEYTVVKAMCTCCVATGAR